MCGFGNRAILIIPRPLALRPCLTTGLPLSFEVGIGRWRAKVEHFVDTLADEVSPAWQHRRRRALRLDAADALARAARDSPSQRQRAAAAGARSDRPRRCGATRRGRPASQPGSWRRSAGNGPRHLYNDARRRTFRGRRRSGVVIEFDAQHVLAVGGCRRVRAAALGVDAARLSPPVHTDAGFARARTRGARREKGGDG